MNFQNLPQVYPGLSYDANAHLTHLCFAPDRQIQAHHTGPAILIAPFLSGHTGIHHTVRSHLADLRRRFHLKEFRGQDYIPAVALTTPGAMMREANLNVDYTGTVVVLTRPHLQGWLGFQLGRLMPQATVLTRSSPECHETLTDLRPETWTHNAHCRDHVWWEFATMVQSLSHDQTGFESLLSRVEAVLSEVGRK